MSGTPWFAPLVEHARRLPDVTESNKPASELTLLVANRPFAKFDQEKGVVVSFKAAESTFAFLSQRPNMVPYAPLAGERWISLTVARALPLSDLRALVEEAYWLVRKDAMPPAPPAPRPTPAAAAATAPAKAAGSPARKATAKSAKVTPAARKSAASKAPAPRRAARKGAARKAVARKAAAKKASPKKR